jgi:DNA gyrase subunit A
VQVGERDQLVIVSREGKLLRTRVGSISLVGRNTQGVKVMRLRDEDRVLEVARVAYVEGMEQDEPTADAETLPEPGSDLPISTDEEGSTADAE